MTTNTKKGFTLVELLSVIVILGIISFIAVPVVSNIINTSKKKNFEVSAKGLVESAKTYYYSKTEEMVFEGKVFRFGENEDISELKITGQKPTAGEIIINADGEIRINITDGEYCAFKNFDSNVISITKEENCV